MTLYYLVAIYDKLLQFSVKILFTVKHLLFLSFYNTKVEFLMFYHFILQKAYNSYAVLQTIVLYRYEVPVLVSVCEDGLCARIEEDTAVALLVLAEQFNTYRYRIDFTAILGASHWTLNMVEDKYYFLIGSPPTP